MAPRSQKPAGAGPKRLTILAELGRTRDPDLMIEMAKIICREKPRASDVIPPIRRVRSGA